MIPAIYTLLLVGCSIVLSTVTFLIGRCGRRLPIDGALPRVVHSARFPASDNQSQTPGPGRWPQAAE
jgi:hypothetical protein